MIMLKRLWVCTLLIFPILLSACAPYLNSRSVQRGGLVAPAQPEITATSVVKIVTMVPQGELAARTPTPSSASGKKPWETAAANIRELLGAPQLELSSKGEERSPNASNSLAVVFVDPLGNRYYVSQDTLQPIEFTLEKPIQETQGSPKTLAELRALAEQIANTHSTRFAAVKDKLTFYEANKSGENYFFRWEMEGSDVGGMPAVFQVGLKQDGTLFGYLNSLDLLP
jgi:hypothetical protein